MPNGNEVLIGTLFETFVEMNYTNTKFILSALDACFPEANDIIPLRSTRKLEKSSQTFLVLVSSTTVIAFIMDIISWIIKLNSPSIYFTDYLAFYFIYAIVIMKGVFFWHLIFLIKIRISLVNRSLSAMKETIVSNTHYYLRDIVAENNWTHSVKIFEHYVTSARFHVVDQFNSTIHRMEDIRNLQDKIMEAVDIVNSSVEFGVLVLLLSCVLHLIVTSYFLLLESVSSGPMPLITYMILIFGHIGRFLIIVEPCHSCIDEISAYFLQLTRAKLKFAPCGFFNINRALVMKVAGIVTTYLVILFQYHDDD